MDEAINYICIESKKSETNDYGKCYISFDKNGSLIYDTLQFYKLEEIENFLKNHSKKDILTQIRKDNVFYFLEDEAKDDFIEVTIRHHENGKERIIKPLSMECLQFDLENFLKNELNESFKKEIYNSLGGYLNHSSTGESMKSWIKRLREVTSEELIETFYKLSYKEQRKIKSIIYGVVSK